MIAWASLNPDQVNYVLDNVPDPMAVFIGVPAARAAAEQRLGDPSTWPVRADPPARPF